MSLPSAKEINGRYFKDFTTGKYCKGSIFENSKAVKFYTCDAFFNVDTKYPNCMELEEFLKYLKFGYIKIIDKNKIVDL